MAGARLREVRAVRTEAVARAAGEVKRPVQILATAGAGPDHPTLPALPESAYLKSLLLRVG